MMSEGLPWPEWQTPEQQVSHQNTSSNSVSTNHKIANPKLVPGEFSNSDVLKNKINFVNVSCGQSSVNSLLQSSERSVIEVLNEYLT